MGKKISNYVPERINIQDLQKPRKVNNNEIIQFKNGQRTTGNFLRHQIFQLLPPALFIYHIFNLHSLFSPIHGMNGFITIFICTIKNLSLLSVFILVMAFQNGHTEAKSVARSQLHCCRSSCNFGSVAKFETVIAQLETMVDYFYSGSI